MDNLSEQPVATGDDAAIAPSHDSIGPLAIAVAGAGQAWIRLLGAEVALARRSLRWLLIGAIAVPVVGLSAWLGVSALLVAGLHALTDGWLPALLFGTSLQLLALAILLHRLRRCARDLALPQSRAVLVRVMGGLS